MQPAARQFLCNGDFGWLNQQHEDWEFYGAISSLEEWALAQSAVYTYALHFAKSRMKMSGWESENYLATF